LRETLRGGGGGGLSKKILHALPLAETFEIGDTFPALLLLLVLLVLRILCLHHLKQLLRKLSLVSALLGLIARLTAALVPSVTGVAGVRTLPLADATHLTIPLIWWTALMLAECVEHLCGTIVSRPSM
jgi:hypothetical protein